MTQFFGETLALKWNLREMGKEWLPFRSQNIGRTENRFIKKTEDKMQLIWVVLVDDLEYTISHDSDWIYKKFNA